MFDRSTLNAALIFAIAAIAFAAARLWALVGVFAYLAIFLVCFAWWVAHAATDEDF